MIITKDEFNNPEDPLHTEDASIIGLNPLATEAHASRQSMHISQSSQSIVLNHSERPMIWHGVTDITELAIKTEVPFDSEVMAVYSDREFLMQTLDKQSLYLIKIPRWIGNNKAFGYEPVLKTRDIYVGEHLPAGTILAHPPTMNELTMNTGTHLMTVVGSFPGSAEDGIIICEDALEKLSYTTVHTVEFDIPNGYILVNNYGEDDEFITLPRVGDIIPDSGIVCRLRNVDVMSAPGMMSPKALRTKKTLGDKFIQHGDCARGEVLSVDVMCNNFNTNYTYGPHTQRLDMIFQEKLDHYKRITNKVEQIMRDNKRRGITTKTDPDLSNLIVHYEMLKASRLPKNRVKLNYKTQSSEPYRVKIRVIHRNVTPELGGKLVDRSSAKSTITGIWPRERMPLNADVIVAKEAGINRTISSRDIEQYINAACLIASDKIRDILGVKRTKLGEVVDEDGIALTKGEVIDRITDDKLKAIVDILMEWSECTVHHVGETLQEALDGHLDGVYNYIANITKHHIVTPFKTTYLSEHSQIDMYRKLEESSFRPPYQRASTVNVDGSEVEFVEDFFEGPIYYHVLDKDAKEISASSGHVFQSWGLPSGKGASRRDSSPVSRQSCKTHGMDESQIFCGALGGSEIVPTKFLELLDRLTSEQTQTAEILSMLESDNPTREVNLVDRRKHPYGLARVNQILDHITLTQGIEFVYKTSHKGDTDEESKS